MKWTWTNARDFAYTAILLNPVAEVAVDFLFENGEFLFAQPNGGRIMRSETGTVDWLPAGFNNASNAFSWAEIHGGYIFAGKTAEAEVYFDTNSDLSALSGDPGDDDDEMVAGPGTTGTGAGVSFLEKLAVSPGWRLRVQQQLALLSLLRLLEQNLLLTFWRRKVMRLETPPRSLWSDL